MKLLAERLRQTRYLLWVFPILLVAGFALGIGDGAVRLWVDGDIAQGLWRTAFSSFNTALNRSVWGAFTLATVAFALAAVQVWLGRERGAALRAAFGILVFFPLFLGVSWLFTDRVVAMYHVETHKLPEIVRQNENFSDFIWDYYVQYLDLSMIGRLLAKKGGWLWPALIVAALFGTWFDRALAALPKRRRRGEPNPRRRRVLAMVAFCAVGVAVLLVNMATRGAQLTNREPRPNVILISIDTLRADRLGCYGNPAAATPTLDRLAANGVLFEDAVSNSAWTLPGHGAMLTGVQPTALGLFRVTDRLGAPALTLAEVLREHGFDTGAIVSYILVDRSYGFDQGFEYFDYADSQPAADVVDKAIDYVGQRQYRKFFLFMHFYDPHWPYEPKEATARSFWPHHIGPPLRALIDTHDFAQFALKVMRGPSFYRDYTLAMYDGEIHDVDNEIGRLFTFLLQQNMMDRTVIVVTSDHGEEFLEHGLFGHGLTLYDESIRVPLLMRFPHMLPTGTRVKGQVQALDIFPTILGLVGLEPGQFDLGGRDLLLAAASGAVDPVPVISETSMSGAPRYALRNGFTKLMTPFTLDFGNGLAIEKPEQVFDLTADPGETVNLAADKPKMVEVLQREMATQMKNIQERWGIGETMTRSEALSADEVERLRSLGYIQ